MADQVFFQGGKFVAVEQFRGQGLEHAAVAHLLQGDRQLHVRLDSDKGLGQGHVGLGLHEHGALFFAQLMEMLINPFQRAVFANQFGGAYLSHAADARHVVGRISADGQHVDDLRRLGNAPFGTEFGDAPELRFRTVLAGFELEGMRTDELPVILVRSEHEHVQPFAGVLDGNGANHVVGLEAGHHQNGDVERLHQFRKRLQCLFDQFRSGGAGAFVGRIQLVAKAAARRVESHGQMAGFLPIDQLQQVLGEAVEDGHVLALGVDHGSAQKCVVHFENQRVAVYQQEFVHILQA